MKISITKKSTDLTKYILIMAAWFGLVTGLVEGVALWSFQQLGWLRGSLTFLGAGPEIIWISALFDLFLFGVLGLALTLTVWFFPRLPILLVSSFTFVFLLFFDWLAIPLIGRISIYAVFLLAIGLAVETTRWLYKHQNTIRRFLYMSLPWVVGMVLLIFIIIQGGSWLYEQMDVAKLPAANPDTPNILVVVVDTLRADHLSGYGYNRFTSHNLDRLAEQGVTFENAFATSPWTKPSHASLLTGRYPYEHQADGFNVLDDCYPTISEALQGRGYHTAAFSANYAIFNRSLGFGRGFHHFEDYYRSLTNMVSNNLYGCLIEKYVLHGWFGLRYKLDRKLASDVNRAFLDWIDRDQPQPFFAFLNYFDPHAPYVPPQPYRSMFSELPEPGGLINTNWDMNHIYLPLTQEQLQGEIDAYDGAIAYVDDHIGQLLDDLQTRGLTGNTLVWSLLTTVSYLVNMACLNILIPSILM